MKKLLLLFLVISSSYLSAQPAEEFYQNARMLSEILEQKNIYLNCQRTVGFQKEKLKVYSVKGQLMPIYTLFSERTSWSAQGDVVGVRMQNQSRTHSRIKVRVYQKGEEKGHDIHLKMQLPIQAANMQDQIEVTSRKDFTAIVKDDLDHPMICRFKKD